MLARVVGGARVVSGAGKKNHLIEVAPIKCDKRPFKGDGLGWLCPSRPASPPERPSLAFDRGDSVWPPQSNAFFFGATDDTGAADDGPARRPSGMGKQAWR